MKAIYLLVAITLVAFHSFAQADSTDKIFSYVEQMPEFPGGNKALTNFIAHNVTYPEFERINNIQGRVVLKFIVDIDGSVKNVQVVKAVSPGIDSEAVRVIKLLPKFTPGSHKGKPVKVYFNLPVAFKLTEADTGEKKLVMEKMTADPYYKDAVDSAKQGLYRSAFQLSTLSVLMFPKDYLGYELLAVCNSHLSMNGDECNNYSKAHQLGSPHNHRCYLDSMQEVDPANLVYTFVEQPPNFPGGDAALMSFLRQNIKYPVSERQNGIQGKVLLKFIVEPDGAISNVTVLRSVNENLDAEAVRVIKLLPKFVPGYRSGKPVRVYFNVPVIFQLPNSTSTEKNPFRDKILGNEFSEGAVTLIEQGLYQTAVQLLDKAIQLTSNQYLNYELLALCYIKMGMLKKACNTYQKSAAIGSPYASTFLKKCN